MPCGVDENTCIKRERKIDHAAFGVPGRTQNNIMHNLLSLENKLPAVDYYVDSPPGTKRQAF
jgi:hypothetical protein